MENFSQKLVKKLIEQNKTISFMESCTGGFLTSEITNIEGSSNVLKVGLITYSTEYKIKFGVSRNIIDEYSVYSINTAKEMAKNVSNFANSDIGVGITGELAEKSSNEVYYAIYIKENDLYIENKIKVNGKTRQEKKKEVAMNVLKDILDNI